MTPAKKATKRAANGASAAQNATRTTIIWVHGMGDSAAGFAGNLVKTLCDPYADVPEIAAIRHEEIVYDDINEQVATKIRDSDAGISALCSAVTLPVVGSLEQYRDPVKAALGDVFPDWLSRGVRTWIFERFAARVIEILEAADNDGVLPPDHQIHLVCHSLGTFVTYEFMHWAKDMVGFGARNFRCENVFLLAPVIALMKELRLGAAFNNFDLAINNALAKPWVTNHATGMPMTNMRKLWAYRHKFDPFASTVPLKGELLDHPAWVFDDWHTGVNMHAYTNYLTEFNKNILEKVVGARLD